LDALEPARQSPVIRVSGTDVGPAGKLGFLLASSGAEEEVEQISLILGDVLEHPAQFRWVVSTDLLLGEPGQILASQ